MANEAEKTDVSRFSSCELQPKTVEVCSVTFNYIMMLIGAWLIVDYIIMLNSAWLMRLAVKTHVSHSQLYVCVCGCVGVMYVCAVLFIP